MIVREYYHNLTNRKKLVCCIRCQERMKPSFMNRHMQTNHSINIKHTCVWCLSSVHNISNSYEHRIECFKRRYKAETDGSEFLPSSVLPQSSWYVDNALINGFAYNSEEIDLWLTNRHQSSPSQSLSPSSPFHYDGSLLEPLNAPGYPYWLTDDSGVDEDKLRYFHNKFPMDTAASGFDPFLQLAFAFKENIVWLHLYVNADQWGQFRKFAGRFYGNIFFLPHWRVCSDRVSRCHRHSIAVLLKFTQRVFLTDFERDFACSGNIVEVLVPGKCPVNLMGAIEYLGNRCHRFSARRLQFPHSSARLYHLHGEEDFDCVVNQSVMPNATFFAMLYLPLGITHYMSAHHSKDKFWLYPMKKRQRGWEIECKLLSNLCNVVFPVPRNMEFREICNEFESDSFLFVGYTVFTCKQNDYLYTLDQMQWNYHQANLKNFFMNALGEFSFRPDYRQQYILNAVAEATEKLNAELVAKDMLIKKLDTAQK